MLNLYLLAVLVTHCRLTMLSPDMHSLTMQVRVLSFLYALFMQQVNFLAAVDTVIFDKFCTIRQVTILALRVDIWLFFSQELKHPVVQ